MPTHFFENSSIKNKNLFPRDKQHFDICFVAHKYMPIGKDKGYDLFIETCKIIKPKIIIIFIFMLLAHWSNEDYEVYDFEDNIHFYGSRTSAFFPDFYSEWILSFHLTGHLHCFPGAFDGFPTGSVTEASLNGVAMFVSDF